MGYVKEMLGSKQNRMRGDEHHSHITTEADHSTAHAQKHGQETVGNAVGNTNTVRGTEWNAGCSGAHGLITKTQKH